LAEDEKSKQDKPLSRWEQKRQARLAALKRDDPKPIENPPQTLKENSDSRAQTREPAENAAVGAPAHAQQRTLPPGVVERDPTTGRILRGTLNPGGRSQGVVARAKIMAGEDGKDVLFVWRQILMDERAASRDRLRAGELLMERAFGKAVSIEAKIDATQASTGLEGLATETLLELARSLKGEKQLPPPPPSTEIIDAVSDEPEGDS
jgi:hypothetical protein